MKISICTGDYRLTSERKKELEQSNIILMTSEMLNSRCRNMNSEHNDWLKQVHTIIVDESHLLTVPGRGDHLEVGLMNFLELSPTARVIFLSATMPNVNEIADWISYTVFQHCAESSDCRSLNTHSGLSELNHFSLLCTAESTIGSP